jgi:DNA-binding transcriptional regulator GbsR (MarR family)
VRQNNAIYFVQYVQYALNNEMRCRLSATSRFIEEMGLMAQERGESRISGRILGLLTVEGRELNLVQISERLAISRASASTNARDLARKGILKLTTHAGDRQDYYELVGLSSRDVVGDLATQFLRQARTIKTCVEDMRGEDPAAARRAAEVQSFLEKSAEILAHWAETLGTEDENKEDDK